MAAVPIEGLCSEARALDASIARSIECMVKLEPLLPFHNCTEAAINERLQELSALQSLCGAGARGKGADGADDRLAAEIARIEGARPAALAFGQLHAGVREQQAKLDELLQSIEAAERRDPPAAANVVDRACAGWEASLSRAASARAELRACADELVAAADAALGRTAAAPAHEAQAAGAVVPLKPAAGGPDDATDARALYKTVVKELGLVLTDVRTEGQRARSAADAIEREVVGGDEPGEDQEEPPVATGCIDVERPSHADAVSECAEKAGM
jgi:hypothetical protein